MTADVSVPEERLIKGLLHSHTRLCYLVKTKDGWKLMAVEQFDALEKWYKEDCETHKNSRRRFPLVPYLIRLGEYRKDRLIGRRKPDDEVQFLKDQKTIAEIMYTRSAEKLEKHLDRECGYF